MVPVNTAIIPRRAAGHQLAPAATEARCRRQMVNRADLIASPWSAPRARTVLDKLAELVKLGLQVLTEVRAVLPGLHPGPTRLWSSVGSVRIAAACKDWLWSSIGKHEVGPR
jgi:hypothetical protein